MSTGCEEISLLDSSAALMPSYALRSFLSLRVRACLLCRSFFSFSITLALSVLSELETSRTSLLTVGQNNT